MMNEAKMKVIEEFIAEMEAMEEDDNSDLMGNMKKVTVAAPTDEGLEMGLSKAESILKKSMKEEEEDEDMMEEEMPEEEEEEEEEDFAKMIKRKLTGM